MRIARLSIVALTLASSAIAGEYDGVYSPEGMEWNCQDIGMDGGALAVKDGQFHGVENSCKLTNPTNVRGMDATLFDAQCEGEGETYSYRLMLVKTAEGIGVLRDGYYSRLKRCR